MAVTMAVGRAGYIGSKLCRKSLLIASFKKITDEPGFKPEYDSLDKIIETTWNWYSKNPNGYDK